VRPYLNDKAKSLLMRLDATRASDYSAVKEFLLHEFALTPTFYLERFITISRQNDETFVLYCSRLKGLIDYYCKSRAVTDFTSLISLLVSDRIKTTLSDDCLKYILSNELRLNMVGFHTISYLKRLMYIMLIIGMINHVQEQ